MVISKFIFHLKCNIRKFFIKLFRKKVKIGKKVTWRRHCQFIIEDKGHIVVGNNCFFNNECTIVSRDNITIGEGSIFGENVKIYDHNHRFKKLNIPLKQQGYSVGKVVIGKNVWVGSNVVILKGANIGDNCVIGAGCVVSGVLPPNSILKISNESFVIEEINNG